MTTALPVALRRAVSTRLSRSGAGQRALAALATAYIAGRRRGRCAVSRHGDHWVHRWPDATITDLVLTSRSPASWADEVHEITLHAYQPRPGDVVIDVGAGVGHETRVLSPLVGPTGHVYAIEANARVHRCLDDMVARNGLHNVTTIQVAASDRSGTVRLADSDDHLQNSMVGVDGGVEVRAEPIDALAAGWGLEEIAFVKMNIEGAERQAIDGMHDVLRRTRSVCISCHDFLAEGGSEDLRTLEHVRSRLSEAGFEVTRRDDARPWVRDCLYGTRPPG